MSITIIRGNKGGGKTLLLSARLYRHYLQGMKVLSNYALSFPHERITSQVLRDWAKSEVELNNCAIGFQEIHTFLDARTPHKNLTATYFLLQTRKVGVHLLGDTQRFRQVDVRLRENCDYVVDARWLNPFEKDEQKFLFGYRVHDMNNEGRFMPPILLRGKDCYGLYDTTERSLDFGVERKTRAKPKKKAGPRTAGLRAEKASNAGTRSKA